MLKGGHINGLRWPRNVTKGIMLRYWGAYINGWKAAYLREQPCAGTSLGDKKKRGWGAGGGGAEMVRASLTSPWRFAGHSGQTLGWKKLC